MWALLSLTARQGVSAGHKTNNKLPFSSFFLFSFFIWMCVQHARSISASRNSFQAEPRGTKKKKSWTLNNDFLSYFATLRGPTL